MVIIISLLEIILLRCLERSLAVAIAAAIAHCASSASSSSASASSASSSRIELALELAFDEGFETVSGVVGLPRLECVVGVGADGRRKDARCALAAI